MNDDLDLAEDVVVLLSGGMDSTALASQLTLERGAPHVSALTVNYGQRHVRELKSAELVTEFLGIDWEVVDLTTLGDQLRSALTSADIDVPHGHYTADTMKATVVPNRNAIMLSVAAGIASSRGAAGVFTAVHAGDHAVYPDCRPEFIEALSAAIVLGTEGFGEVWVAAPFVNISKAEIAQVGHDAGAPFALSWSCYEGGRLHCGQCGTCVERAEAFALSGVQDPTEYATAPPTHLFGLEV